MKKKAKAESFLNEPYFKGGKKAMGEFIQKNLKYPPEALKNKIEGSVSIKFDINHKGKVIKTSITKGIGNGCDEEATRVVKLLRFECHVPKGMKAIFHRNIKIDFKLPPVKTQKISYNITASKNKSEKPKQTIPQTYTYSIKTKN